MNLRVVTDAQILDPTPENIKIAAEHLKNGLVVGMPTETVYGLAGDALNESALTRIFKTKERPTFDPLIVHVAPPEGRELGFVEMLERLNLVDPSPLSLPTRAKAEALMQAFWPGPLTLVLPKHRDVPDLATSGLPTVAVRMPRHPVAQALIAAAGTPLAAPSANRFGRISPTSAEDVMEELGQRIELILDGGPCEVGVESTIVAVEASGTVRLLRPGGIARDAIEEVIGGGLVIGNDGAIAAPGMLASHYAPRKKLHLLAGPVGKLGPSEIEKIRSAIGKSRAIGLLVFQGDVGAAAESLRRALGGMRVIATALSEDGDREEAARALFGELRALDGSNAEVLFAEPCPDEQGLGYAIADRLRKASHAE